MLDSLKVRFPELPWPNDISSTDKASYSVSFLALLKMTVKNLTKEERILSKEETALVLLERRIEVNFVPELTKKKSKIKTPKLNELTDIDCTACEAKTGVWKLIGETVMLNILQLCCTECGTALSEPFNVLRKVSKKKESSAENQRKKKQSLLMFSNLQPSNLSSTKT